MMKVRRRVVTICLALSALAPPGADAAGNRVIVEPIINSSGDGNLDPLNEGFSDLIVAYLSEYQGLEILYREDLYPVWQELARSHSGVLGADALQLGALIQASTLVKGGFVHVNGTFQANVHVYDIETAALRFSLRDADTIEHVDRLAASMAQTIAKRLLNGSDALTTIRPDAHPVINTHFMKGLGHYYNGLFDHAVAQFMLVVDLDPSHADARLWLGKSYAAGGESAHARIEYQRFLQDFPDHKHADEAAKSLAETGRVR